MTPPIAPRTLAHFPDLIARLHAHGGVDLDVTNPSTQVIAPCCGRVTLADTILDVRHVKGTVVRGGGHQPARDHDWLCDGCRHRLVIEHPDWTESKLLSAVGYHPDVVRHYRARELADEVRRNDDAAGRPHRPHDAFTSALSSLPPGRDPHRRRPPNATA